MSIERCEKHDYHYDTDKQLECPRCENEAGMSDALSAERYIVVAEDGDMPLDSTGAPLKCGSIVVAAKDYDALLARFDECEESNYGGQALVDQLRVEKQVAEQERDDARKLNDQSVCAYCGYIGTRDADCITEHILACEKHPLKTVVQLEAQLAAAQERVTELESECKSAKDRMWENGKAADKAEARVRELEAELANETAHGWCRRHNTCFDEQPCWACINESGERAGKLIEANQLLQATVTALRAALERIISLEMREFRDAVEYMHMIDKLAHAALSTASKQYDKDGEVTARIKEA